MSHISRKAAQIERTKGWVVEALIQAAESGDYPTLSVSDLCKKAGIGRQTFYRHYKSKEDVIADLGIRMYEEVLNDLNELDASEVTVYRINLASLRVVARNKRVMSLVRIPELRTLMSEVMDRNMDFVFDRVPLLRAADPMQNQFNYWAWKGVMFEWVRQDFRQTPEEIARLIATWTNQPGDSAASLKPATAAPISR